MEFLAAAIQYDCIFLKKEENLAALTRMIRDAANQGAKLIVLPEMCTTGYYFFHRDAAAAVAEEIPGGETVGHLARLCARHGCYIAAGLMEREGEILYNSAVLIGPEGFIGKHRKLHFFAPDGHWAQEGDLPITVFETPIGKIAMLICMDISFPEAARTAGLLGADIICCPVNWFDPVIPSNIWVTRAYENQLFFVVANRLGEEAGFSFSGGSCVIAPNVAILDHVRQKTGIAYGTIRLPRDTDASRFPRRRLELYRELSLRRFNWSQNLLARTFSTPPLPDGGILRVAVSPFVPAGETLRERQAALCDHLWEECPTAELAVFPELALTGAGPLFLSDPAEELRPLARYCAEQGLCLVVGGALRENALYNAAFVITEEGEVHTYRKAHLSSASQMVRQAAVCAGGMVAVARNPVSVDYARENAAPGAVLQAIELGSAMLAAQPRSPEAVIGTVCDFLHGRVVGSGPVSKLELTCKNGFDVGTLYIGGLEATFWNEFMTLEREGERLATFPDLITMLDAKTGMPVTSATAEEGQELTVVHVPAEHIRLGAGMRSRDLFLPCEEAIGKPIIAYAFQMNDFSTVLISILGFSYVAAFILIVATWTTNDNNLYSSVLGVSTLFRELNIHVSRWKVTLVAGVLATAFGAMGVINIFVPFLSLLCVLIPPFASVMVVDYFFHKTDYDYAKAGAIPSLRKHTLASAVIGCLVGLSMNTPPVGFGIPFMVQLSGVVPTALAAMAAALAADAIFEAAGRKA